jgi:hypothetical protein
MTAARVVPRRAVAVLAVVAALAFGACSSGSPNASAIASIIANASPAPASAAPTASPSAASSGPASEAPSESALPSAVVTDIDPCQLITADEASSLVGVTFGAGKESETDKHLKLCSYAGPGPNVFNVEVAVAPDVATAKAAEQAAENDLQAQATDMAQLGLTVTKLPNFAPNTDAALMQGSRSAGGISIDAKGMLLLKNATFVGFNDVAVGGGKAPSEQAMKDKAMEVLAKLP